MGRGKRWLGQRSAQTWLTLTIVGGCALFSLWQLHPDLVLRDSTPAGGDMGAHVWGPAYLRDHLLPAGRLTGWSPDWYAGFPAFQFYMIPPALLIVLLDVVLPYGVAMKVVTVSGVMALPVAAWAMARLLRMPFPVPALLAVAVTLFSFDRSWTIYGGNIASTLAGEYSFTISLALALLFFGVFGRSLESGRHRGLSAALLALTILCHAIPAFFAIAGAGILVALHRGRARFAAPVLLVGALLTSFWSVPFVLRRHLLTDMGWERLEVYGTNLFPDGSRWVIWLAAAGFVISFVERVRFGIFLGVAALASAAAFRFDALSVVHIWNARLLPFYYLTTYLLAGLAVALFVRAAAVLVVPWLQRYIVATGAVVTTTAALVFVALPLHALPGGALAADGSYRWGPFRSSEKSFIGDWARWNYSGYEGKAAYPEYRSIVSTMDRLGATNGCGRAHWEYESELDRYGTPMALMLLPYWTDGCIGSMEGLYFESSATTPFHFLNASEVSAAPSNPVRDQPDRRVPYHGFDLDVGIPHLRMMGVRYYLAFSDAAVSAADARRDLRRVAASSPWVVYEIEGASIVEGLTHTPAVGRDLDMANPGWQDDAIQWYVDPSRHEVALAADGPEAWQRIGRGEVPDRRPLPRTVVSDVREDDHEVSFRVDRVGQPVLVKVSYFPNWKVKGAEGPYRVAPNSMVVVPTEREVRLVYGYTWVDRLGWVLTLLAVAGLWWLSRRGAVALPELAVRRTGAEGPVSSPPNERSTEVDETDGGPEDPAYHGASRGTTLLDVHGELDDREAGPLRP